MVFMELDHGAILRKESGLDTPKMVRLVIGNPQIMKEMAKLVHDAGSYAPVTVLVDERPDGVYLTYDKMASFLAPYGNADALAGIWIPKSSAFFEKRLSDDTAVGHRKPHSVNMQTACSRTLTRV